MKNLETKIRFFGSALVIVVAIYFALYVKDNEFHKNPEKNPAALIVKK